MTTDTQREQNNSILDQDNMLLTSKLQKLAPACLNFVVKSWFIVAVFGQLLFALYVLGFYGTTTAAGNFEMWNKVLPHGYAEGDTAGNFATGSHVLLALIVLIGGPLQFVQTIRRRFPRFHHVNGRLYVFTGFILAIGGVVLIWVFKGGAGSTLQHIASTINAALILICGGLAIKYAVVRNIKTHQQWVLRLFMVMNGVWFFRVGIMFWLFINKGPVGFDPVTFQGPFLNFLSFAQFVIPLVMLEFYFAASRAQTVTPKIVFSLAVLVCTLCMLTGIAIATMGMWLPKLNLVF